MRAARYLPLLVIVAAAVALIYSGLLDQLAPDSLLQRANTWLDFAGDHPVLTLLGLFGAITAATALGLPGAAALFGAGGFLIGVPLTLIAAALGNMVGTAILYQAIRAAFGRRDTGQPGSDGHHVDAGLLARARSRFQRNPFAFALFLRAIPVAPNGVNTALLAALRCPWPTFLASSALGVLPNALLLSWLGNELASEARQGRLPDASLLADPRWWLPLALIALLALAPVLLSRRKPIIAADSDL